MGAGSQSMTSAAQGAHSLPPLARGASENLRSTLQLQQQLPQPSSLDALPAEDRRSQVPGFSL